jgi:hypothetical protein
MDESIEFLDIDTLNGFQSRLMLFFTGQTGHSANQARAVPDSQPVGNGADTRLSI